MINSKPMNLKFAFYFLTQTWPLYISRTDIILLARGSLLLKYLAKLQKSIVNVSNIVVYLYYGYNTLICSETLKYKPNWFSPLKV